MLLGAHFLSFVLLVRVVDYLADVEVCRLSCVLSFGCFLGGDVVVVHKKGVCGRGLFVWLLCWRCWCLFVIVVCGVCVVVWLVVVCVALMFVVWVCV